MDGLRRKMPDCTLKINRIKYTKNELVDMSKSSLCFETPICFLPQNYSGEVPLKNLKNESKFVNRKKYDSISEHPSDYSKESSYNRRYLPSNNSHEHFSKPNFYNRSNHRYGYPKPNEFNDDIPFETYRREFSSYKPEYLKKDDKNSFNFHSNNKNTYQQKFKDYEPEWFTEGPTSHLDKIELQGFDEKPVKDYQDQEEDFFDSTKNLPGPSMDLLDKNFAFGATPSTTTSDSPVEGEKVVEELKNKEINNNTSGAGGGGSRFHAFFQRSQCDPQVSTINEINTKIKPSNEDKSRSNSSNKIPSPIHSPLFDIFNAHLKEHNISNNGNNNFQNEDSNFLTPFQKLVMAVKKREINTELPVTNFETGQEILTEEDLLKDLENCNVNQVQTSNSCHQGIEFSQSGHFGKDIVDALAKQNVMNHFYSVPGAAGIENQQQQQFHLPNQSQPCSASRSEEFSTLASSLMSGHGGCQALQRGAHDFAMSMGMPPPVFFPPPTLTSALNGPPPNAALVGGMTPHHNSNLNAPPSAALAAIAHNYRVRVLAMAAAAAATAHNSNGVMNVPPISCSSSRGSLIGPNHQNMIPPFPPFLLPPLSQLPPPPHLHASQLPGMPPPPLLPPLPSHDQIRSLQLMHDKNNSIPAASYGGIQQQQYTTTDVVEATIRNSVVKMNPPPPNSRSNNLLSQIFEDHNKFPLPNARGEESSSSDNPKSLFYKASHFTPTAVFRHMISSSNNENNERYLRSESQENNPNNDSKQRLHGATSALSVIQSMKNSLNSATTTAAADPHNTCHSNPEDLSSNTNSLLFQRPLVGSQHISSQHITLLQNQYMALVNLLQNPNQLAPNHLSVLQNYFQQFQAAIYAAGLQKYFAYLGTNENVHSTTNDKDISLTDGFNSNNSAATTAPSLVLSNTNLTS